MKTKTSPVKNNIAKKQINWLMGILVLLSIFAITIRLTLVGSEPLAGGDQLWKLNISFSTSAASDRATLHIFPPIDTANIRTVQRNISHLGFKIRNSNNEKAQAYLQTIANKPGKHSISSEYLLHLSQTPFSLAQKKEVNLSTEQREKYLQDDENFQITSPLVQKTLKRILLHRVEPDQIISEVYSLLKHIPASTKTDILNVPDILKRNKATVLDRSLAMVSLSRAAGIPARLVSGIILKEDIDPSLHYWVQVFQNNQWVPYDPHYGYEQSLPINYLPVRRNGKDIIQVIHGELGPINFVLDQEYGHPYLNKSSEVTLLSIFNLTRLPLNVRNELALLLLLPLGALLTALFRQLVGVHSYGVFTPTLLALAIVYTNLATTLVIFIVVSFLAVWGRSIFPATITRVPRLSIIFTLIAIILALSVSV
ncbi:MAG: transglutaminase-like domain-containing protein, partial [Gammaproteobacteria bacterium]|nr:transglutaminase-like domain-containing protein [Gammaproteobacteria bacterium]